MKPFILSLADPQADLSLAGGKGMSLAICARAGLPVPDGFHLTTEAYRHFVTANDLQTRLLQTLEKLDTSQTDVLEAASQTIYQLFMQGSIPPDITAAVSTAYSALSPSPAAVAVRSSATAEDLPDASFAGQQETYLNISGLPAVLEAVKKCWASLWTARAIAYRQRQGIPSEDVALAVVIQLLVPADAAGILFTANPVNGHRGQAVINAAWGLGEAVVGGAVTPDTLTVEKTSGRILQRQIAKKEVITVRTAFGTENQAAKTGQKERPVLSDPQALELVRLGDKIEALYQQPMDIEWTLAEGKFAIVQARPITSLGEAPLEWKLPHPKGIYMRTSIVDLMPEPLSPLFATLGINTITSRMVPIATRLTRSTPSLPPGYFTTINGYAYMNAGFNLKDWMWILFGMLPSYPHLLRILVSFWRDEAHPQYQKLVAEEMAKNWEDFPPTVLWQSVQTLVDGAADYICTLMFATMGVTAGAEGMLTRVYDKFARRQGDPDASALLMGWDNLPAQAEKSLFDLAAFCRMDPALEAYLKSAPSSLVVSNYHHRQAPENLSAEMWQAFCLRFDQHLQKFGYMVFNMDFSRPLPLDHPEPMIETIKMYLNGEGVDPYVRQQASERRREELAREVKNRLKGFKRWAFDKSLAWAQSQSEVREDALAEIGLAYPLLRQKLAHLGKKLVTAGALQEPEDIYWMEKDEISTAVAALEAGSSPDNLLERVEQRKAFWKKALNTTPPPMLPPRKSYMGFNTSIWLAEAEGNQKGALLKGVPASPGRITAPACVLHGPEDFTRMRPGAVLVASTTTPAWTPLFAMASAVVTDIGGPLSHGSIVAREYSIPAVMGTGVATRRIQDGQNITVDGSAGTVTLI
ncbi:MAG TPA: PEP/pyruvate-binding domain-containing protein [Anaerolineaceae bacterium]|nr:PEP/pyruvate-binding domain-containing protein [Anaerolineaceae bacterium]HPN53151.1 PEP/pyruvate-binding domain-containing protein [Anaerolineaceae bacterium]